MSHAGHLDGERAERHLGATWMGRGLEVRWALPGWAMGLVVSTWDEEGVRSHMAATWMGKGSGSHMAAT
jgi:hypothetical protein